MNVSLVVTGLLMMIPNMSFANNLYDEIIQPETSIQDSEGKYLSHPEDRRSDLACRQPQNDSLSGWLAHPNGIHPQG
ncbi:hypothetical protein [Cobetia amphilecti]|uniref:hypothetical protein n=1 Tax=Cobetia amphilecti TaxID=1055104 RepID=UPI0026E38F9A|nr:hypothetical protein [Cobetia amphilecti]MDO6814994.1 hypothetical protein [Cobetia amphilecti]